MQTAAQFPASPGPREGQRQIFTVLEEDDVDEEEPTSEDEEEDDQSSRARLMRGILQAGRLVQDDQPPEDDPDEPVEVVKEEPEKEKNLPTRAEDEESGLLQHGGHC